MSGFIKKIARAYRRGTLWGALSSRANSYFNRLRYIVPDVRSKNIVLHSPEYVQPLQDRDEIELVKRIFQSFKQMKHDQKNASKVYVPSSMWQKQLKDPYSYLIDGLASDNLSKFHFFLCNFGAWKQYHGVEATTLIRDNMKSIIGRQYLKNDIFGRQLRIWKWFYNNRKPLHDLTYPTHGNQSGAYIDNVFVGPGSFFNEIYGSMLEELISGMKRPIVADLGAGYGKLAYFILHKMDNFVFIDFDLPETLCLAAYYLMKSWPDKKAVLYGEETFSSSLHRHYDLIFMPSYEIGKVEENSIDLFINKNSLGEMTKEAAINYINYIAKSAKYFFHMNHEIHPNIYDNDERGLLGYEYPVPCAKFKLLFRYPEIGHLLYQEHLNFNVDIFLYLYMRKNSRAVESSIGSL